MEDKRPGKRIFLYIYTKISTNGLSSFNLHCFIRNRVNLARALYRNADVILMDDPLSAVDARVSSHIFENCVRKYLRGKLRILVTHQLQYLPQASHIIILNFVRSTTATETFKQILQSKNKISINKKL